jgi:quercetin dioxygenase-like cupin family protein
MSVATSLESVGQSQLEEARRSSNGRASTTLHHGHRLHQTLLALTGGTRLAEHQSPGDATVLCLHGRIALNAGTESVIVPEGTLVHVPARRHDLVAEEDSVVVLTVAR